MMIMMTKPYDDDDDTDDDHDHTAGAALGASVSCFLFLALWSRPFAPGSLFLAWATELQRAIQLKPGRAPGHGPASISVHQIRGGSCPGVLTSIRSTSSGAKMEGLGVSRDDIGGNKIDQTRRAYIKMPM